MVLMIASWPEKLQTNVPSGHFHFLMLFPPALPLTKLNSVGWMSSARTLFLWCVSVASVRPAARSHSRTVLSMLPVITCGSLACARTTPTVPVCPARTCTCAFVRMSHTRADASRPAVMSTSSVGCSASEYTPDRWPW
jgi:hypothetical protein